MVPLSAGALLKTCRLAEWNDITGLGAGCSGCYLAEVSTAAEAVERIRAFRAAGLKIQILGAAMNFVGTDELLQDTVFIKLARGGDFSNLQQSGTLILAGSGQMAPEEMMRILEARDRSAAGDTAPPKGLTLEKIEIPEIGIF